MRYIASTYLLYILLILVRKFMTMDVWVSVTVHAVNDMEGKKLTLSTQLVYNGEDFFYWLYFVSESHLAEFQFMNTVEYLFFWSILGFEQLHFHAETTK